MSFTESSHRDAKTRGKKVMTFGTFDLFHPGHVYYISQAESLADELIIIIARDERVKKMK
jgi:cytidyltransferase-like protein